MDKVGSGSREDEGNPESGSGDSRVRLLEPEERRHADFGLSFQLSRRWDQNKTWSNEAEGGPPEIKAVFGFDDEYEIDDDPFVTKFADDATLKNRFFGVAYARSSKQSELCRWAASFKNARLLTYDGKYIQDISTD